MNIFEQQFMIYLHFYVAIFPPHYLPLLKCCCFFADWRGWKAEKEKGAIRRLSGCRCRFSRSWGVFFLWHFCCCFTVKAIVVVYMLWWNSLHVNKPEGMKIVFKSFFSFHLFLQAKKMKRAERFGKVWKMFLNFFSFFL